MTVHETIDGGKDFGFGDVQYAVRGGESTVIGAGFVGAGFAADPFGGGVEREEPIGQLGAKKAEGRNSGKGGEVAGAGVIADEHAGVGHEVQQLGNGAGRGDGGFAGLEPPVALFGIADDADRAVLGAEAMDEAAITVQRPDTNWLAGSGVDEDGAAFLVRGE